jgi:hypothetical protein
MGASCGGGYITSVETLLTWVSCSNFYGSQESRVFYDIEGIKYMVEKMDRINLGF